MRMKSTPSSPPKKSPTPAPAQTPAILRADAPTLEFAGEKDRKLRVTYLNWADVQIVLPGEWLGLRCENGQAVARKKEAPK
jgi:hypothetical protein